MDPILVRHRNIDILLEYIITIPELLIENKSYKNMVQNKLNEFINADKNESFIETAHLMYTVRKLNDIIKNIDNIDNIHNKGKTALNNAIENNIKKVDSILRMVVN